MAFTDKITSTLSYPSIYLLCQAVIGGLHARKICIRDYVCRDRGLTVLDIGCGPGYCIRYFRKPHYYGFDISPEYIASANSRYSAHGHFFCRLFDEKALALVPPVDVVILMGVLHHLNDCEVRQLLTLTKQVMKPGAELLALDGCYRPGQSRVAKYLLDKDRGKHVRDEAGYLQLVEPIFDDVQTSIREDLFFVPYTKVVIHCRV